MAAFSQIAEWGAVFEPQFSFSSLDKSEFSVTIPPQVSDGEVSIFQYSLYLVVEHFSLTLLLSISSGSNKLVCINPVSLSSTSPALKSRSPTEALVTQLWCRSPDTFRRRRIPDSPSTSTTPSQLSTPSLVLRSTTASTMLMTMATPTFLCPRTVSPSRLPAHHLLPLPLPLPARTQAQLRVRSLAQARRKHLLAHALANPDTL